MRKRKAAIGILLIVMSLAGLFFWETNARDKLLQEAALTAKEEIEVGTKITADMLAISNVREESLLSGALLAGDEKYVLGKVTRQYIPKNSQISKRFVGEEQILSGGHKTIFPVKAEWIDAVSSSVRRGDKVSFYTAADGKKVGQYVVAFIKDSSGREVISGDKKEESDVLGRIDADAVIRYVEIIAEPEECKKISKIAESGGRFLILQDM